MWIARNHSHPVVPRHKVSGHMLQMAENFLPDADVVLLLKDRIQIHLPKASLEDDV